MTLDIRSPRVIIARSMPQHSMRTALALQKAGLLKYYYTGLYTSWKHPPLSYLSFLPKSVRVKLFNKYLSSFQRHHPDLDENLVRVYQWLAHIVSAILFRIGVRNPWGLPGLGLKRFQLKVAQISKRLADILIVYDCDAYYALEATKDSALIRILDLATTHWASRDAIFRNEAQMWPQLSDKFLLPSSDSVDFQRKVQEPVLADYVLVGSNLVKSDCIRHGIDPNKVYVAYYGVDTHLFSPPPSRMKSGKDTFKILFAGGDSPAKGFHYLVDTLRRLHDLELELWICGLSAPAISGDEPWLINHRLKYWGFVSQEKMAELMKQVDMLFHPSILDSFSLTCLQAMASGLPVLTTDQVGVSELITNGESGFVVHVGDVQSMQGVITDLVQQPTLRQKIGENARKVAEQYTWDAYDLRIRSVINEIWMREQQKH